MTRRYRRRDGPRCQTRCPRPGDTATPRVRNPNQGFVEAATPVIAASRHRGGRARPAGTRGRSEREQQHHRAREADGDVSPTARAPAQREDQRSDQRHPRQTRATRVRRQRAAGGRSARQLVLLVESDGRLGRRLGLRRECADAAARIDGDHGDRVGGAVHQSG